MNKARPLRIVGTVALLLVLQGASSLLAPACRGTSLAPLAGSVGAFEACAQTVWGVSHRTARRTSRRVGRRQVWRRSLPYYDPVVVAGTRYYLVEGVYYEPSMLEGAVAYTPVEDPRGG